MVRAVPRHRHQRPLLGIDVRPADGQLYGIVDNGAVVTIDPCNGKAQFKSQLAQTLPAGVRASVDFNPSADRLRIIGSDGTNLRANVDDGVVHSGYAASRCAPANPFGR